MRKLAIIIFSMLLSSTVWADYCASNYSELETSLGTYKFSSEKLCREAFNLTKKCEKENDENYKAQKKKYKRIDCAQKFMSFISDRRSEVERVNESY
jgi:hypothetical protein